MILVCRVCAKLCRIPEHPRNHLRKLKKVHGVRCKPTNMVLGAHPVCPMDLPVTPYSSGSSRLSGGGEPGSTDRSGGLRSPNTAGRGAGRTGGAAMASIVDAGKGA